MSLPSNLERLPPEAIRVIQFMGTQSDPMTPDQIDQGTKLGVRLVGKAIRRLVNFDLIQISPNNSYILTSDGRQAVDEFAENDARLLDGLLSLTQPQPPLQPVQRRLTVVMPRIFAAGKPTDIYFGVNPPDASLGSSGMMLNVELKVSANGGSLSSSSLSLEIPGFGAAKPSTVSLTPQTPGKVVRVRVDAFQTTDSYQVEALGGIYFDIQVATAGSGQDLSSRAVGMDLLLKPVS
jgi:hypothetical protein